MPIDECGGHFFEFVGKNYEILESVRRSERKGLASDGVVAAGIQKQKNHQRWCVVCTAMATCQTNVTVRLRVYDGYVGIIAKPKSSSLIGNSGWIFGL